MDFNDILSYIPGDTNPKYSSKIYFAGNEDEFGRYFDVITKQILNITNKSNTTCTIWFRKHFGSLSEEENQLLNDFLAETHLIIVPITRNLLLKSDGVMQTEINFAKNNNKPLLPIIFENDLTKPNDLLLLYSRPSNFGNIQYLNPYDTDPTAIPYEKKLSDYLSTVLINDEMRIKIQAAFDAYVFLSYRKKDRAHAQKLMHLIHENDFCRDIAIWYDEFLTPGEDFNEAIKKALLKSKLFALLVTPNIIEPNNYIIKHEYPMAQQQFKENKTPILPIECVETDTNKLRDIFDNIPPCTKSDNPNLLADALKSSLKNIALMKSRNDPIHNYFIGLAYLNGIDVEIDYERAIMLFADAADLYLKNIEEKDVHEKISNELMKFVLDLSDTIASLARTSPNTDLSCLESRIYKFISVFDSIPLKDSNSDLLKIRTRLYTVAADFEKTKGNTTAVFTLMNNSRLLTKEIYSRDKVESNRELYFNISLESARSAFDAENADAAFYIINNMYKEWKSLGELDQSEENVLFKSNIYLNFAKYFKIKNSDEDATAFYEEAVKTAAQLCNKNTNGKNMCCLLSIYFDFGWYKLEIGDLYTAINLFNSSLESYMLFSNHLKNSGKNLTLSVIEDQRLAYYYWASLRGIARAYSETKQFEKEEPYLRILLELKKDEPDYMWENDHYNLAICLYCQNRLEDAAPFFEKFIELISSNITAENRYQYAFSLLQAATFNQEKAHEYIATAFDNLLILYNDNPNDGQVVFLLKKFLGDDFNKQEEDQ